MPIGYVRVSIDDQSLDLHRNALRPAGGKTLHEDHIGSAEAARRTS